MGEHGLAEADWSVLANRISGPFSDHAMRISLTLRVFESNGSGVLPSS